MNSENGPGGEHHDLAEVAAAIAGLGEEETKNLKEAARSWVWDFRLDPARHNGDDLFAEAITLTLEGRRRWTRGIHIMAHLIVTMRSIASHWREWVERRNVAGFRVLRQSHFRPRLEDGDVWDPVEAAPSPGSDPERSLIAREEVEGYLRHFAGDPSAMVVIFDGWVEGLSGPEIEERLGLSLKTQRAAVRRVRRYAWKGGGGEGE